MRPLRPVARLRGGAEPACARGPQRHAVQHTWARRARRLPVALRRRLESFRFAWVLGPPDFMLPTADAPTSEPSSRASAKPSGRPRRLRSCAVLGSRRRADPELLRRGDVRKRVTRLVQDYGGDRDLALRSLRLARLELQRRVHFPPRGVLGDGVCRGVGTLEPNLDRAIDEDRRLAARDGIYALLPTLGRAAPRRPRTARVRHRPPAPAPRGGDRGESTAADAESRSCGRACGELRCAVPVDAVSIRRGRSPAGQAPAPNLRLLEFCGRSGTTRGCAPFG